MHPHPHYGGHHTPNPTTPKIIRPIPIRAAPAAAPNKYSFPLWAMQPPDWNPSPTTTNGANGAKTTGTGPQIPPNPVLRPSRLAPSSSSNGTGTLAGHQRGVPGFPLSAPPPPPSSSRAPAPAPPPVVILRVPPTAPLPEIPSTSTFTGLGRTVTEGSFSDILTNALEENYMKHRLSVINELGELITPLIFLKYLMDELKLDVHFEESMFQSGAGATFKVQYRTEIYAGVFCGVGHGPCLGFSGQLAAAHVLERMRVFAPAITQNMYALYPGTRYTQIGRKLDKLCENFKLGQVKVVTRRNGGGGGKEGRGGNLSEVKWQIDCFVEKKMATVLSDDPMYGMFLAKKEMYLHFVQPPPPPQNPVVQFKDYFAVGVDCPRFNTIHKSVLLTEPGKEKLEWMEKYKVGSSQLDDVLNDPRNNSGYLLRAGLMDMEQFKRRVEVVVGRMRGRTQQGAGERNGNNGMGNRRFQGNAGAAGAAVLNAGNEEMDDEDLEGQDIYHDARMEVE